MNVARELAAVVSLVGARDEVEVHKGTWPVSDVYEEEPDLDDVLYMYEQALQAELKRRGPYRVDLSWKGRPKLEGRGGAVTVEGAVNYRVFIETVSATEMERILSREVGGR